MSWRSMYCSPMARAPQRYVQDSISSSLSLYTVKYFETIEHYQVVRVVLSLNICATRHEDLGTKCWFSHKVPLSACGKYTFNLYSQHQLRATLADRRRWDLVIHSLHWLRVFTGDSSRLLVFSGHVDDCESMNVQKATAKKKHKIHCLGFYFKCTISFRAGKLFFCFRFFINIWSTET